MSEHAKPGYYAEALEALKLVATVLGRILPREEHHILGAQRQAVRRLESLVTAKEAQMHALNRINENRKLTQAAATKERERVASLDAEYRHGLRGRYSRTGASRYIVVRSKIPKKRVDEYLKDADHVRGSGLSSPDTEIPAAPTATVAGYDTDGHA